MESKPPVWPALTMVSWGGAGFVASLVMVAIPGNLPLDAIMMASSIGVMAQARSAHMKLLERRKEWRKQKFENWLSTPVPDEPEQKPWSEIERATAELLMQGTEPTYERAEDWLRRERVGSLNERLISTFRVPPTQLGRVDVHPNGWHDCPECGRWHYAPYCSGNTLCSCDPERHRRVIHGRNAQQKLVEISGQITNVAAGDPVCDRCGWWHIPSQPCGRFASPSARARNQAKCMACGEWHRPGRCRADNPFRRRRLS